MLGCAMRRLARASRPFSTLALESQASAAWLASGSGARALRNAMQTVCSAFVDAVHGDVVTALHHHVRFVRGVDARTELHDDASPHDIAERIAWRYFHIWLPHVDAMGDNVRVQSAPIDVAWAWHVHTLAPLEYHDHCIQRFGHALDGPLMLRHSGTFEDVEPHEWHAACARAGVTEDVDIRSASSLGGDTDELVAAAKQEGLGDDMVRLLATLRRQRTFAHQVSLPHWDDDAWLALAAARYVKFLTVKRQSPDTKLAPTYDIDLVWHTHLNHHDAYIADTGALLQGDGGGRAIALNHDDSIDDRSPDAELASLAITTASLWRDPQHKGAVGEVLMRGSGLHRQVPDAGVAESPLLAWADGSLALRGGMWRGERPERLTEAQRTEALAREKALLSAFLEEGWKEADQGSTAALVKQLSPARSFPWYDFIDITGGQVARRWAIGTASIFLFYLVPHALFLAGAVAPIFPFLQRLYKQLRAEKKDAETRRQLSTSALHPSRTAPPMLWQLSRAAADAADSDWSLRALATPVHTPTTEQLAIHARCLDAATAADGEFLRVTWAANDGEGSAPPLASAHLCQPSAVAPGIALEQTWRGVEDDELNARPGETVVAIHNHVTGRPWCVLFASWKGAKPRQGASDAHYGRLAVRVCWYRVDGDEEDGAQWHTEIDTSEDEDEDRSPPSPLSADIFSMCMAQSGACVDLDTSLFSTYSRGDSGRLLSPACVAAVSGALAALRSALEPAHRFQWALKPGITVPWYEAADASDKAQKSRKTPKKLMVLPPTRGRTPGRAGKSVRAVGLRMADDLPMVAALGGGALMAGNYAGAIWGAGGMAVGTILGPGPQMQQQGNGAGCGGGCGTLGSGGSSQGASAVGPEGANEAGNSTGGSDSFDAPEAAADSDLLIDPWDEDASAFSTNSSDTWASDFDSYDYGDAGGDAGGDGGGDGGGCGSCGGCGGCGG